MGGHGGYRGACRWSWATLGPAGGGLEALAGLCGRSGTTLLGSVGKTFFFVVAFRKQRSLRSNFNSRGVNTREVFSCSVITS